MKVTTLDERSIHDIGYAFGYYDYGEKTGMSAAFSGKEATANYICAYVRGVLRGDFLHTISERGEGYIAYKLPKEKMGLKTMWPIVCGMLRNSTLKRLLRFGIAIKRGGASLQDRMDKEKKPFIFVIHSAIPHQTMWGQNCLEWWVRSEYLVHSRGVA